MGSFIQKFKIPIVLVVGFVLFGLVITRESKETPQQEESEEVVRVQKEQTENLALVTFVVDGDTVEIESGERVRLIGIDAPERGDSYYSESKVQLEKLVLNKQVRLEKDVSQADRYGRLLRYVFVGDLFVNLEMVKKGYALAYTYPPDVKY